MSSPSADQAQAGAGPDASQPQQTEQRNADMDAEMAEVGQENASSTAPTQSQSQTQTQNATLSSSHNTLNFDSEFASTQQQTTQDQQPGTTDTHTSNSLLSHHNRKDVTLREFLSKMDDYAPIIPDAVTAHYLTLAGLPPPSQVDPSGASTNTTPLPLARLLALATQKFIADIATDAYQYSRIRASNSSSAANPLGATAMIPGQGVAGAAGGVGGAGVGAGKAGQSTHLGVQRAGYGGGGQGGSGQGRTVLTMEDLGMAVQEYGVNVKRGEFYR